MKKINLDELNFATLDREGFIEIGDKKIIVIIYLNSALRKIFEYWGTGRGLTLTEWLNKMENDEKVLELQRLFFCNQIEKYVDNNWNKRIFKVVYVHKNFLTIENENKMPDGIQNKNDWRKNMKDFLRNEIKIFMEKEQNIIDLKIKSSGDLNNEVNKLLKLWNLI